MAKRKPTAITRFLSELRKANKEIEPKWKVDKPSGVLECWPKGAGGACCPITFVHFHKTGEYVPTSEWYESPLHSTPLDEYEGRRVARSADHDEGLEEFDSSIRKRLPKACGAEERYKPKKAK